MLQNKIHTGFELIQNQGVRPFAWQAAKYLNVWYPVWNTVTSRCPIGTNIFERDWDVMIILDTCRFDILRSLSDIYSFIGNVERMRSVGSMSAEWMLKTFTEPYLSDINKTAFVAGNIWVDRIFNERIHEQADHEGEPFNRGYPKWDPVRSEEFAHFEMVYPYGNQDDKIHPEGHIPHVTTDRAIEVGREQSFERLIVHYTLPHLPFVADSLDWVPRESTMSELMSGLAVTRDLDKAEKTYEPARRGEVSVDRIREMYTKNLQLVLEYAAILLKNIDADTVVISADHGEGFGTGSAWGHPYGYPFPPIKTVPWVTTTATDHGVYDTKYDMITIESGDNTRLEFLKDMGYL